MLSTSRSGDRALLFTVTILVSSTLLFAVQPLFARMVLPLLGGAPAVWTVSLCFFQGALLAGYAYAHLLRSTLSPPRAGALHVALLALAALSLPIAIPAGWRDPPAGEPALWQLGLFAVAIGAPFTLLSANAPLLQSWYASTGEGRARNPYVLYAASNLGSLAALLGYPFLLEPLLGVTALARTWAVLYLALLVLIALCALAVRSVATVGLTATGATDDRPDPTVGDRLRWVWYAAVPSALLTAFTAHIATDLASAPLIWVVPLALYLLTFVIVFRDRPLLPPWLLTALHVLAVAIALLQLAQVRLESAFIGGIVGGLAFIFATLSAHQALYDSRPAPRRLTEFYLWLSAGGALGGVFAALVAPRIFREVYEYPLLLALSIACRPGVLTGHGLVPRVAVALTLASMAGSVLLAWLPRVIDTQKLGIGYFGPTFAIASIFALVMVLALRAPRLRAIAAVMLAATVIWLPSNVNRGEATRSFFGVYRVRENYTKEFHYLSHGTTLHGAQRVRDADGTLVHDTTPLTYYHPESPMAKAVFLQREQAKTVARPMKVGIVGLGTGALTCYAEKGEQWRIFEIDPAVVKIATNPINFSFVDSCLPKPDIVLGDARLTIAREPDGAYDLLIVDAFSSDAVPVHLLTREALSLYLAKLAPTGVAVLHISNRYLDLDAAVSATVSAMAGVEGTFVVDNEHSSEDGFSSNISTTVAISRSPEALALFRALPESEPLDAKGTHAWTDDHADVLGAILRRVKWPKLW